MNKFLLTLVILLALGGTALAATAAAVPSFGSASTLYLGSLVNVTARIPAEQMLEVDASYRIVRVLSNANAGDTPTRYCRYTYTDAPCIVTAELRNQLTGIKLRQAYGVVYP